MEDRQRCLNGRAITQSGPVICWISRDLRADDHWGLIAAQQTAIDMKQPLIIVFCCQKNIVSASDSQFAFMLRGLKETTTLLAAYHIKTLFFQGSPNDILPELCTLLSASAVYCDFSPLRQARVARCDLAQALSVPLYEVDSHNIIPCWLASGKQAYAAYTFRPAVNRQLEAWLQPYPDMKKHPFELDSHMLASVQNSGLPFIKLEALIQENKAPGVLPEPGCQAAFMQLKTFLDFRLANYHRRNDPNESACSGLSPWLHFGFISAQRAALEARKAYQSLATDLPSDAEKNRQIPLSQFKENLDQFLEELIVRKELSDNYCFYNQNYDNLKNIPDWAVNTLRLHQQDPRPRVFSKQQLEGGETEDPLWNAAQKTLVKTGYMHGYLRMYWAKKILEWTIDPDSAISIAVDFNDRYALDGHDPNGYTGIAWSIGGVHDRAWSERPVFGKIRYMSYNGCRRKFDVDLAIETMKPDWIKG